jgi:uncharacterized protein with FMN-binding domain
LRRAVTAVVSAFALAAPAANAGVALTRTSKPKKPKKRVVTAKKTVVGDQGYAGRWGTVTVTLVIRKTTTIVGKRKTVKRKVVGLKVPVYPDHTNRSVFINQQALPLLEQEVLTAHYTANIDMISGATDTSGAFIDSLQSALLKVKTV